MISSILLMIFQKNQSNNKSKTFESKGTEFLEIEISTRYYVFITSYINRIQPNGRSGIVVIIRDMTNEHNLDQMKKTLSLMYPMNYAHPFPYYKVIRNQSLMA